MALPFAASVWHKVAGVSGAVGILAGSYGAHGFNPKDSHFRSVFETANRYHMFHSLLLAVVPLTRRPTLTGVLTAIGLTLFSGSCYLAALKEDKSYSVLAPYGGLTLVAAWLSLAL